MGYKIIVEQLSNIPALKSTTDIRVSQYSAIGAQKVSKVIVVNGTNIGFVRVEKLTQEAAESAKTASDAADRAIAASVSAVQKAGDIMAGTLNMEAPLGKQITFDNGNSYISNTNEDLYIRSNANEQSKVIIQGNVHPDVTVGTNTGKFYTELNKPTPAEIGTLTATEINNALELKSDLIYVNTELGKKADKTYTDDQLSKKLNLSGGDMTGDISSTGTFRTSINQNLGFVMQRSETTYQAGVGQGSDGMAVIGTGTETNLEAWLKVGPDTLSFTGNDVYHSGNKPTAADVGTMTSSEITNELNKKADKTYTDIELGKKADKTYVDTELGKKADLTYVNTELAKKSDLSYVNTELGKKFDKVGGTLSGQLIVANMKSAIAVDNQKSISFQDQSGTMYHMLADGNNFKIKHGVNADHPLVDVSGSGLAAAMAIYSRSGLYVQSKDGTKGIGLEVPEGTRPPYVSVRTIGDSVFRELITFNPGETTVNSGVLASTSVRVATDGGLMFSGTASRGGVTWGMGVNETSRELCIHRYLNGAWQALPFIIQTDGTLNAASGLRTSVINCSGSMSVSSINVNSGYLALSSPGNSFLEFHTPGQSSAMIYKTPDGVLRFVSSNGGAGETALRMSLDTAKNLTVVGGVWAASFNPSSDRRLKSDIVNLENCLEKSSKIVPCSYNKVGLAEGKREVGVIAQDVQLVLPDAVNTNPMDGYYGVNYASITALNTGSINELYKLVQELQEEIRILKSK